MAMPEEIKVQQPETPATLPNAQLRDKRVLPEGVVPKQAQGYVIAGLAVLILMAVMFSKDHARPAPKETASVPPAVSTDMNQQKIQELEQDLSADQRQGQREQQTRNGNNTASTIDAPNAQTGGLASPAAQLPPPTGPPRDPIADAEKALAFKARFASNLVSAEDGASHSSPADSADAIVRSDTGNDAVPIPIQARPSSTPQGPASQAATTATGGKRAPEVSVNSAHGQPYVVFEGTTIDTVLTDRLDGEFAGPVKVMVTDPVYSQDRQHLLIPEGTFILGDVRQVAGLGQRRLAVTFHRLLMPDGYSVDLDQFHGLDQGGDTGLKDKANNHYLQIFGASIALGIIAGGAESSNANVGLNESGTDAYKAGIASSLSQSSADVLDRFINIPPTITIREGHRIKVYITEDMLLPAYEDHTVPGDI